MPSRRAEYPGDVASKSFISPASLYDGCELRPDGDATLDAVVVIEASQELRRTMCDDFGLALLDLSS